MKLSELKETKNNAITELPHKMTSGSAVEVRKGKGTTRLFLNYNGENKIVIRNAEAKVRYIINAKSPEELLQKIQKADYRYVGMNEDTQTSEGDWIISQFEANKLTYQQARKALKDKGLDVWVQELNMADELKKDNGRTLH